MKALHTVQIKTTILVFWTIVFALKKGVNFISLSMEIFQILHYLQGFTKFFNQTVLIFFGFLNWNEETHKNI